MIENDLIITKMSTINFDGVEFLWNNIVCQLQVKDEFLYIWCLKKLNPLNPRPLSVFNKCISIVDIVSIHYGSDVWKVDKEKTLLQCNMKNLLKTTTSPCSFLSININTQKNRLRKMQSIKLLTSTEKEARSWQEFLISQQKLILEKKSIVRPKHLLVFVNPYGGRKKAVAIHANVVSPLFKLAGIKETAIVTERRNHAKDYVETTDLSAYDGIIAVGGDGMVNEIMNGVLVAAQKSSNISIHDDAKTLHQKPLDFVSATPKIGLIPAGSTNCLSYVTQGIDDPETASMHIICGENHPLDVCSIHDENGRFIRFSFSMTSYGYFGKVLQKSENLRRLGPSRYDVAGVSAFTHMRTYSSEVTYFLSSSDHCVAQDQSRCRYPCQTCLKDRATNSNTICDDVLANSKSNLPSGSITSCAKDVSIYDEGANKPSSEPAIQTDSKDSSNANEQCKVSGMCANDFLFISAVVEHIVIGVGGVVFDSQAS